MAKKTSPHDPALINFCNKPAATLAGFKANTPPSFSYNGKNYKIVLVSVLPSNIKLNRSPLDLLPLQSNPSNGGASLNRAVKLNIGTVINRLKGLKNSEAIPINNAHGEFAIVHSSVELIKPEVSAAAEFKPAATQPRTPKSVEPLADVPETSSVEEPTILAEDVSEVDVEALKLDERADAINFALYRWSAFLSKNQNQGYEVSAKDFVLQNNGIAVIEYAGRKKPIGFMFPDGFLKGDGIETNGRYAISHVAETIKGKWAAEPLKPAVITISNMRGAPMVLVTMGAALKLREKGVFDNAPDWVKEHLNTAQADLNQEMKKRAGLEGVDTSIAPAPKPKAPVIKPPLAREAVKPVAVAEPVAVTHVEARTSIETQESQVVNALAAVRNAIATAKATQTLVKVGLVNANGADIVHIGADEHSIKAMLDVIDFAKDMGAQAPNVELIEYNPSTMTGTMTAIRGAWNIANDSNSLVILAPAGGQRLAMTRNKDLLEAYTMSI